MGSASLPLYLDVSIRAPRAGGDADDAPDALAGAAVSIRAPRAGGDEGRNPPGEVDEGFNPRPPCGRRLVHRAGRRLVLQFQSAPPVREATWTGPGSP